MTLKSPLMYVNIFFIILYSALLMCCKKWMCCCCFFHLNFNIQTARWNKTSQEQRNYIMVGVFAFPLVCFYVRIFDCSWSTHPGKQGWGMVTGWGRTILGSTSERGRLWMRTTHILALTGGTSTPMDTMQVRTENWKLANKYTLLFAATIMAWVFKLTFTLFSSMF